MTIHSTARYTNVMARLASYLTAQVLTGSPTWVVEGNRPTGCERWVRLSFELLPEQWSGYYDATQVAVDARMLIVCDLFWPDGSEGTPFDAYEIDRAADDLLHLLRFLSLSFYDYSSDPASPTAVAGAQIRVIDPPELRTLTAADGRARRQVVAEARWYARHTPA